MKKKSATRSAFLDPRVLVGLAVCAIGVLLALLAFGLYPGGKAFARPNQSSVQDQSSVQELAGDNAPAFQIQDASATLEPDNSFGTAAPLQATCPSTVLPNDNSTSANARAPSTRYASSRAVYLITAAELSANGYLSGNTPTSVGWNYNTAPGVSGSAPLKIYLQNTTDTTYLKGTSFSSAIAGMTTVHNATTTLPGTAGTFDIPFVGGSPLTYNGGGLYVAYDWGAYAGTLSTTAVVWCNSTGLVGGLAGVNSGSDALGVSNFRPETRLSSAVQNDVAVGAVYSYGELPRYLVPAQIIKAVINNKGALTQTSLTTTLNVTGVDTFTNMQTIASLAACTGQSTVTFAAFNPVTIGSDTVAVFVPPDDVAANNSLSKALNITALNYSYKHPGSTAAGGVGFTSATGTFVGKFTTTAANAITDVKLEFFATSATTYKIAIYGDNAGTPSTTALYVDATDRTVTVAGPVSITLPSPVAVGPGNFYVGIQQTNATNSSYSFDTENPIRSGAFFSGAVPPTAWTDFSPGTNFKLNIGLILQTPAPTPTATSTATATATATATPTATATTPPTPTPTPTPPGPALDGFDPNANGPVRVVVVQPDGKILLGGDFTTLSPNGGAPVTRNFIARLNPDGTLDTAFNPNAQNTVFAMAVQADGKILAGGGFTSIGGQTRNFIARLDATTGLADSFNPNANSSVLRIAVQADGKILAGGGFTSIGGQTRNGIARLAATTGLADSFNPNAGGVASLVLSIAVQADGKILAGGAFTNIGGQTRNRIARLDATTGLADSFNPNAGAEVYSIAVQADGKILAGGGFTSIGGQTRNRIARLDATTGLADSFNPNSNALVESIVVQADGKILAGGLLTSIGGQTRNNIARLDATTGLADSFNPNANGEVTSIAVQADGKILAGGFFTSIGGQTRNRIARLETDGRLDQTLNLNIVFIPPFGSSPFGGSPFVFATAVQPDGKILIGGKFTTLSPNGGATPVTRNNIARVNTNGALDLAFDFDPFDPNANNTVDAIAVQADGKILIGGTFTTLSPNGGGPVTRNRIARLNPDGTLDTAFNPNANNEVDSIATQPDGKILVGGQFSGTNSIGGQTRYYIARLDATTGMADSFNPNANGFVQSIAVQADGKILAGGQFNGANSIGGQTRNRIARLDATTGLADSFNPNANNEVDSIATQPDGMILVGGQFSGTNSIGTQTRNFIARLDPTGMADSFDPNANGRVHSIVVQADGKILAGGLFNGLNCIGGQTRNYIARLDATAGMADSFDAHADNEVDSIATQPDGKILVGGQFSGLGGDGRNVFARLRNDTAALQDLAVTQTTITWTRGGSSPQLARVTFESSTDNMAYTLLGNGTAAGSNWTMTGLSLPTGQNFYIRARGSHSGGFHNASESITESVRNAFIAGPISFSISGSISYCSNPVPGPVPNVTLALTGSGSGSTLSNGSGNYTFIALPPFGNYTVTPTKSALTPGSAGINTVDVIAMQGHALGRPPLLTGCRLTAADVNGDTAVNTVDVIAVQAFVLARTGFANTGKYQFNPASRPYPGVVSNQTGQNYDTLIFGDVASTFVHRPDGGPAEGAAGDDMMSYEVPATVAAVTLPEVAVDQLRTPKAFASGVLSRAQAANSNFVAAVRTTAIDAKIKLVGFQGDFTFDERVVTFESQPVSKAGLTGGNWNVSGNVLAGAGPMRTLRVSAYSNDFTALSGSGTLFELRMTRVSQGVQGTPLLWASPPDNFIFIDSDLKTQKPGNAAPGSVTAR